MERAGKPSAPGGLLSIVPTPIGNLEDITLRALRILREADVVAAEDTRRTRTLLSAHALPASESRLQSYHAHSGPAAADALLDLVAAGRKVAFATDAGMPGVSDPGGELVRRAIERGVPVDVLPGSSAATTALVASGFAGRSFRFEGFLPLKSGARGSALDLVLASPDAVVLFEAPGRLAALLRAIAQKAPGRRVFVGREMTKLHQEYAHGTAEELAGRYEKAEPRGEATIVVAPAEPETRETDVHDVLDEARARVADERRDGTALRPAVRTVAASLGVPANALYRALHESQPPEGRTR